LLLIESELNITSLGEEVDREIYALSQYGGIYNYYIHAYQ